MEYLQPLELLPLPDSIPFSLYRPDLHDPYLTEIGLTLPFVPVSAVGWWRCSHCDARRRFGVTIVSSDVSYQAVPRRRLGDRNKPVDRCSSLLELEEHTLYWGSGVSLSIVSRRNHCHRPSRVVKYIRCNKHCYSSYWVWEDALEADKQLNFLHALPDLLQFKTYGAINSLNNEPNGYPLQWSGLIGLLKHQNDCIAQLQESIDRIESAIRCASSIALGS